jgi:hypothetical protein
LESTTGTPFDPAVCDRSERLDSPPLVVTLADTPMLAALIALASPESELSVESNVKVCGAVSNRLESTVNAPPAPGVSETSERLDDPLLVTTEAVTPIAALLIAAASVASVLLDELTAIVCAVPLPTWIEIEPESVSAAPGMDPTLPDAVPPPDVPV